MAVRRNKQQPARTTGGPRGEGEVAPPPHLRHIIDLLRDVGPILDHCQDLRGDIDWEAVGAEAQAATGEIEGSLLEQMAPYDAFDIVGIMLLYNVPIDPEIYRESEHDGRLAKVEDR